MDDAQKAYMFWQLPVMASQEGLAKVLIQLLIFQKVQDALDDVPFSMWY